MQADEVDIQVCHDKRTQRK